MTDTITFGRVQGRGYGRYRTFSAGTVTGDVTRYDGFWAIFFDSGDDVSIMDHNARKQDWATVVRQAIDEITPGEAIEIDLNVGDTFLGESELYGWLDYRILRVVKSGPRQVSLAYVLDHGRETERTARPFIVTRDIALEIVADLDRVG